MDAEKSYIFRVVPRGEAAGAGAEEKKTKKERRRHIFGNVLPRVVPRADVLVRVKDMFGEGALSLFRGVCPEATGSALVAPARIHTNGGIFRTLFDHFWGRFFVSLWVTVGSLLVSLFGSLFDPFWDHVFCHLLDHCLDHFWITCW